MVVQIHREVLEQFREVLGARGKSPAHFEVEHRHVALDYSRTQFWRQNAAYHVQKRSDIWLDPIEKIYSSAGLAMSAKAMD